MIVTVKSATSGSKAIETSPVTTTFTSDGVPASATLVVTPLPQLVTFTSSPPTNAFVGGPTYVAGASGGPSTQPVVIASTTPSVCTIASGTVSFVASGICTLEASQAGDDAYAAATPVDQSFAVGLPSLVISVNPTPPVGTIGKPYSFTFTASGGDGGPYTWSVVSGTLPPGLTLTSAGVLWGTPTAVGSSTFTVGVDDPATQAFTVVISAAPTADASPAAATRTALALTGLNLLPVLVLGVSLLLAGACLLYLRTRRRGLTVADLIPPLRTAGTSTSTSTRRSGTHPVKDRHGNARRRCMDWLVH
jgi:hypothetical protein